MQEELLAARGPHPRDQIRPPVLDPLILGLQDFDHLAVHAKQVPGLIGGQALEGIPADDVLDGHGRRLTWPRGVEESGGDPEGLDLCLRRQGYSPTSRKMCCTKAS